MRLHQIHSSKIILEAEKGGGMTGKGDYKGWKNDPHPFFLILGTYQHPRTGKEHIAAINLNYVYSKFGDTGLDTIRVYLPQILTIPKGKKGEEGGTRPLYGPEGRYWKARNAKFDVGMPPDTKEIYDNTMKYIMDNFYREYLITEFASMKRGRLQSLSAEEYKAKYPDKVKKILEDHLKKYGPPTLPEPKEPEEVKPPAEVPPELPPAPPEAPPAVPPEAPPEELVSLPEKPEELAPEAPPEAPKQKPGEPPSRVAQAAKEVLTPEPQKAAAKTAARAAAEPRLTQQQAAPIGTKPAPAPAPVPKPVPAPAPAPKPETPTAARIRKAFEPKPPKKLGGTVEPE